ncbi:hypothetical protein I551_3308 [Mycobacterium ulcerans str. Harvey]|uniref:Uncharacterized protein n=1 Tax=Mycobacterium ulcerans str. Harvey TaxID=1299332 RepID=A0ABP3AG37_MYCUL|nr:hypothetical protein I551_3308 [Mycobacterium ulcerans str. Harvey]
MSPAAIELHPAPIWRIPAVNPRNATAVACREPGQARPELTSGGNFPKSMAISSASSARQMFGGWQEWAAKT